MNKCTCMGKREIENIVFNYNGNLNIEQNGMNDRALCVLHSHAKKKKKGKGYARCYIYKDEKRFYSA